jgi:hypothetical protein
MVNQMRDGLIHPAARAAGTYGPRFATERKEPIMTASGALEVSESVCRVAATEKSLELTEDEVGQAVRAELSLRE